jgi:hypothetical protein
VAVVKPPVDDELLVVAPPVPVAALEEAEDCADDCDAEDCAED